MCKAAHAKCHANYVIITCTHAHSCASSRSRSETCLKKWKRTQKSTKSKATMKDDPTFNQHADTQGLSGIKLNFLSKTLWTSLTICVILSSFL